jgi:hypothetical protein
MATHFEEGLYRCEIINQALVDGEQRSPSKTTAPSVQITIKPIGFYDSEGEYTEHDFGWDRTIYLYLTEDTVGKDASKPGWVFETLRFLGFNAASFGLLDPSVEGACSFIGKQIDCLCRHEAYQGKNREKWSVFRPKEKKDLAPAQTKTIRTLDAMFGKLLKTHSTPCQAPTAPTPTAPPVSPPASNGHKKKNPVADALNAVKAADATPPGPRPEDIPF